VDLEKYLTNKSSLLSRNAPPLGSVVFSSSNIIYATGLQGIILNEFVLFESSNIYGRVERFDNKYKCINVNRAQLHKVIPNERVIGIGYFLRDNDTFFARYTKIVRSGLLFFLRNSKTHLLNVDPLFPERQSIPVGDIDFISGNMVFVTNLHNVRLNELIIFEPSRIKGVVTRYDKKYTCVRLMRLEGDKIKLRERAIGTGHVLKNTDKLITRLRRVLALKTTLLSQSPSIHLLDNDPLFSMRECIPVG